MSKNTKPKWFEPFWQEIYEYIASDESWISVQDYQSQTVLIPLSADSKHLARGKHAGYKIIQNREFYKVLSADMILTLSISGSITTTGFVWDFNVSYCSTKLLEILSYLQRAPQTKPFFMGGFYNSHSSPRSRGYHRCTQDMDAAILKDYALHELSILTEEVIPQATQAASLESILSVFKSKETAFGIACLLCIGAYDEAVQRMDLMASKLAEGRVDFQKRFPSIPVENYDLNIQRGLELGAKDLPNGQFMDDEFKRLVRQICAEKSLRMVGLGLD